MTKYRAIFAGLLSAFLVSGTLLVLSFRRARRDLVIPQGRAVILDPSLAGHMNAADLYQQALPLTKNISKEDSEAIKAALRRPWTDTDGSLASLLQRHAPLMAFTRKAAMLPRFEPAAGLDHISYRTPLPQFTAAILGAKLLLLDGRRLLAAGHPAEALDDALTTLAISGQFERERNFALLDQLTSSLLVSAAFPLLSDLISSGLNEPQLAILRNALQPLAQTDDAGRGIQQELDAGYVDAEVLLNAWYIPPSMLKKMILDVLSKRKEYAEAVADGARRNIPGIQQTEVTRRRVYGERPDSNQNLYFCMKIGIGNPSAFGDCMIAYPFTAAPPPDYSGALMRIHLARCEAAVLLAAVGIRLYELSRHMPPPTLQDLAPDFLPLVPRDNFNGFQPLRYALGPNAWTVYGVGPDRKDDGGIAVTAVPLRWTTPHRRSRNH